MTRPLLLAVAVCFALAAAEAAPTPEALAAQRSQAIDTALRFLQRHQSPNGQWDVDGYGGHCQDAGPKAEPGQAYTDLSGDVACTALALLSFIRAGHVAGEEGPYRQTIEQGLHWLIETQANDGVIGRRNYEHAMATWALVAAYAAKESRLLKKPIAGAVKQLLDRQAMDGKQPLGWDYTKPNPRRNDSSISQWNLLALAAAADAGLRVERRLQQTAAYVLAAARAAQQEKDTWIFPYTWDAEGGRVTTHNGELTGGGLLCAALTEVDADDPVFVGLAATAVAMAAEDLSRPPCDGYHLLPFLLACEKRPITGGPALVTEAQADLIASQAQADDCLQGSWDERALYGGHRVAEVGRLLLTCLGTLCLTVEAAEAE